jgi:hypothetical protein
VVPAFGRDDVVGREDATEELGLHVPSAAVVRHLEDVHFDGAGARLDELRPLESVEDEVSARVPGEQDPLPSVLRENDDAGEIAGGLVEVRGELGRAGPPGAAGLLLPFPAERLELRGGPADHRERELAEIHLLRAARASEDELAELWFTEIARPSASVRTRSPCATLATTACVSGDSSFMTAGGRRPFSRPARVTSAGRADGVIPRARSDPVKLFHDGQ